VVELGGEGLVVREDEGGALDGLDDLGHGEGFAGAGDAEQDLVLLAGGETGDEFADGSGLVALGLVGGGELEVHLYRIAKDRFEVRGTRFEGKTEQLAGVGVGAGTELWLVRHGETEWSAAGRHTSRTDLPLTERGRERAAALGKFLAGTKFAAVLRSPMRRARETCEIAGFGDVAVVDDGLREWDYGVYEGRTTDEIQAEIPGWSVWNDPIVGGETVEQVGARADGVIARALAAASSAYGGPTFQNRDPSAGSGQVVGHPDAAVNVALFGHAHILRILAARWIGLEARGGELFALETGSVSVLGWERETRVILRWNRGFEE
jgi:broad specificity phosphatase PhoE